jgi:SAM-dependent methyltransferase
MSGSVDQADDPQSWDAQRVAFGAIAQSYDSARPQWPLPTAAWLTGTEPGGPLAELSAAHGLDVVDLAAGTGKLTRPLSRAGHRVTAVDVSEGMLDVLRQSLPEVRTVVAKAEQLPLPAHSADVVTVAQAWHWFDPTQAATECARILRPGGLLAIGWHRRVAEGWVVELNEIAGSELRSAHSSRAHAATLELTEAFGQLQSATFEYDLRLTPGALATLASTWSYVAVQPDRDRLLAEVEALGEQVAGPDGTLTLPHVTYCYRAEVTSG